MMDQSDREIYLQGFLKVPDCQNTNTWPLWC